MSAPILPRRNMAGAALSAVTLAMSFLACLALGGSLLADRAAERWLKRASSAMTVQIVDTRNQTAAEQLPAIMRVLETAAGVAEARVLTRNELVALLEPWLGAGNVGDDLPVPLLVEITPDSTVPAADALAAELAAVAPGARLDTHGHWRATLAAAAGALRAAAVGVLALVAFATATVIVFATRAGLLANRDILDVLHQIGATDGFIARRFESHFVRVGTLAASGGFLAALGVFYALGGLIADARAPQFLLPLAAIPLALIAACWSVTRFYVFRNLAAMD